MPEKETGFPPSHSDRDGVAGAPSEGEGVAVALRAELVEANDRLLRSLAEQENIRAQARRERDDAVRYAAAGFAGDLLASLDNLERAIASVPADQRSEPGLAGLLTGVEATRRSLLGTFSKHGLKRIDPAGEVFDPHSHEASFETDDERYPPGTVTTVIQPGYRHHDRLLRPALVGVSRARELPREA